MASKTKAGAQKPADIVDQHIGPIWRIAETYGTSGKRLAKQVGARLSKKSSAFARAVAGAKSDRQRAQIVALAACLEADGSARRQETAEGHPNPAKFAFAVERLDDPVLRDTLYSHYWSGASLQNVAKQQRLRTITTQQNHKRALKHALGKKAAAAADDLLEQWKSRARRRPAARVSEQALLKGMSSQKEAGKLSAAAQELLVDALAATARESAMENEFLLGSRSLRGVRGRPWIEPGRRVGLLERPARMAAEDVAEYDLTRTYNIANPDQGWTIQMRHRFVKEGPQVVDLTWMEGNRGVVVIGPGGEFLAACSKNSPMFRLPRVSVPYRFTLRPLGKLD